MFIGQTKSPTKLLVELFEFHLIAWDALKGCESDFCIYLQYLDFLLLPWETNSKVSLNLYSRTQYVSSMFKFESLVDGSFAKILGSEFANDVFPEFFDCLENLAVTSIRCFLFQNATTNFSVIDFPQCVFTSGYFLFNYQF